MGSNEEHDPMCPARCDFGDPSPAFGAGSCRGGDCTRCDESECYCDFIAKVRADATIKAMEFCCADTEPDIRKRVAEEIAQALEAERTVLCDGQRLRDLDPRGAGLTVAAAIARRIGSEVRPNGL